MNFKNEPNFEEANGRTEDTPRTSNIITTVLTAALLSFFLMKNVLIPLNTNN